MILLTLLATLFCGNVWGQDSQGMLNLLKKVDLADLSTPKTDQEVDEYLACYSAGNQKEFGAKYKYMIEAAAKAFDVSPVLMKCLIFRESQWDKDRMSCTCATGLGQQVLQNASTIDELVGDSITRTADIKAKRRNSDIQQRWDGYMKDMKRKNWLEGCSGYMKHSQQETDKNSEFYKQAISHREKGCGKNPVECPIFRQDDRRCPAASISATAAYLHTINNLLTKGKNKVEWWQVDDAKVALALAYNSGEGTVLNAMKKGSGEITPMSIGILSNAAVTQAKSKEMHRHYQAVRSCLIKSQWGSPVGTPPSKNECRSFRRPPTQIAAPVDQIGR